MCLCLHISSYKLFVNNHLLTYLFYFLYVELCAFYHIPIYCFLQIYLRFVPWKKFNKTFSNLWRTPVLKISLSAVNDSSVQSQIPTIFVWDTDSSYFVQINQPDFSCHKNKRSNMTRCNRETTYNLCLLGLPLMYLFAGDWAVFLQAQYLQRILQQVQRWLLQPEARQLFWMSR